MRKRERKYSMKSKDSSTLSREQIRSKFLYQLRKDYIRAYYKAKRSTPEGLKSNREKALRYYYKVKRDPERYKLYRKRINEWKKKRRKKGLPT